MAQVTSDSANKQHRVAEPIQHFAATVEAGEAYTPYIFLKTRSLASLPPALVVGGSLWELTQPSNAAANYLRKSDWAFCQDREKIGSVKSFTSCTASPRPHS